MGYNIHIYKVLTGIYDDMNEERLLCIRDGTISLEPSIAHVNRFDYPWNDVHSISR